MLRSNTLNKNNIDEILTTLGDYYDEMHGKEEIHLYIVGGAAVVLNFTFRKSTIDIDALYMNNVIFNEAIEKTAQHYKLPYDWLNQEFKNTPSYSDKINCNSVFYKKFGNNIKVYVLPPKYLIAMKLKSSRPTGGDLEDIIMMIYEMRYNDVHIEYEEVIKAYEDLYNDFANTYSYFLERTKKAFETPIEEFEHLFKNRF